MISQIQVENLRNISSAILKLAPSVNFIFGENGSGKTSLLEAVYLLGTGGSFRTGKVKSIVKEGESATLVTGIVTENRSGRTEKKQSRIGVRRSLKGLEIKKNGEKLRTRAELARTVPLLAVTPTSHYLLEAGPRWRRRYLDWGVFHVEQNFSREWSLFQRALKQRNKLLGSTESNTRVKLSLLDSLDKSFLDAGLRVEAARDRYFASLLPVVQEMTDVLLSVPISIELKKGYPDYKSFSEIVHAGKQSDVQAGVTRYGPHRADLTVRVGKHDAKEFLSRGQQKLLIYALLLAQIKLLKQTRDRETVLLLDDVASELDENRLCTLLNLLQDQFTQVMITAVDEEKFPSELINRHRVFHVKHGQVS